MNMIEGQMPVYPSGPVDRTDRPGRARDLAVSFEFFPPRQADLLPGFWGAAADLAALAPRFISVTYGAGGSTRDQTRELVVEIQNRCGVPAAAHLTCVDATRDEIDAIADSYWQAGIHRLVALRGDPKAGIAAGYHPTEGGYPYADALVAGLARQHPFDISVAAYPEVHPQAPSAQADLDHLKRKVDAGATRAITQFFFDVDCYKRFIDRATRAGINVPIVPGILPIRNLARTATMAAACGARIPDAVRARFDGVDHDPQGRQQAALEIAIAQCQALLRAGVKHFHFYTLNQAELVRDICAEIGLVSPLLGAR
ncbi:methylenetetrahydrofolate reductase [NAD(P)H] [Dongia sp.]|uniref:methylenetetrahydrofolate reductase [NAD(P)H] n=1 Tax=Dongia sp. TaxID=1977262 RepID=UPI0035AE61F8